MLLRTVAAVIAVVSAASCAARGDGKGLLPHANPAAFTPSSYQPELAFAAQTDGALARPVFRTDGATPYRVDIRDLLVPPAKTTPLTPEGIAIVDTLEGIGVATVQERKIELTAGTTFGVSQGQTARLQNNGKSPLLLRVYVVTVQ